MAPDTRSSGKRPRQTGKTWRSAKWWALLGGAALAVAVAALVVSGPRAPGNSTFDFPVALYQGQDLLGSSEIILSSLLGDKPIVLNFWAGLCPPCRAEMPDLQAFNDKFEDRALLLGIDLGQFTGLGNTDEAKELLAELEITYPAGFTEDASVVRDYQVLGMPTTIFIDANGEIFNKWTGALNGAVLEEKTLEMLAQ